MQQLENAFMFYVILRANTKEDAAMTEPKAQVRLHAQVNMLCIQ